MRISVETTAKLLGTSADWVRFAIQNKKVPFGDCIKRETRHSYLILSKALAQYLMIPEEAVMAKEQERLDGNIEKWRERA